MNKKTVKLGMTIAVLGAVTLTGCGEKFTSETKEGIALVKNEEGATLGYSPSSRVQILTKDRYAFKDLNKNGTVDVYEDWRLPVNERAKDLAQKMSLEDIGGLMLYSSHQSLRGRSRGFGSSTYDGKKDSVWKLKFNL